MGRFLTFPRLSSRGFFSSVFHALSAVFRGLPRAENFRCFVVMSDNCDLGPMEHQCALCGAKFFYGESLVSSRTAPYGRPIQLKYSACCSGGKVEIPPIQDPPPGMMHKYLKCENLGYHNLVMPHIRNYNQALCFGSHQVKLDSRTSGGIYSYRIQGSYYHRVGGALPSDNLPPSFAQIYFYDVNFERELQLSEYQEHAFVRNGHQSQHCCPNAYRAIRRKPSRVDASG